MEFKQHYESKMRGYRRQVEATTRKLVGMYNRQEISRKELKDRIFELEQVANEARSQLIDERKKEIDNWESKLQGKLYRGDMSVDKFRDLYEQIEKLDKDALVSKHQQALKHDDEELERVTAAIAVEKGLPEVWQPYSEKYPEFGLAMHEYKAFKDEHRGDKSLMWHHMGDFHHIHAPEVKFDRTQKGFVQVDNQFQPYYMDVARLKSEPVKKGSLTDNDGVGGVGNDS